LSQAIEIGRASRTGKLRHPTEEVEAKALGWRLTLVVCFVFALHVLMLRALPQFDKALAVVAFFHQVTADADARTIIALPFMPFDSAIVFVAHLALLTS